MQGTSSLIKGSSTTHGVCFGPRSSLSCHSLLAKLSANVCSEEDSEQPSKDQMTNCSSNTSRWVTLFERTHLDKNCSVSDLNLK